jgi:chemotaxis family two-component system response regulator Rcp1
MGNPFEPLESVDSRLVHVLIVEDNQADVMLMTTALRDAHVREDIHVASTGEDAIAFLRREKEHADAPRPDLVFLDLSLPRLDGHQVLEKMKADPELRSIPVLVISGSNAARDVARAYQNQVAAYLVKPAAHDDFFTAIRAVKELWLHFAALPPKSQAHSG